MAALIGSFGFVVLREDIYLVVKNRVSECSVLVAKHWVEVFRDVHCASLGLAPHVEVGQVSVGHGQIVSHTNEVFPTIEVGAIFVMSFLISVLL